jgi:hypothetical protein
LLAATLAACGAAHIGTTPAAVTLPAGAPCGAGAAEELGHTVGVLATRIYGNELSGGEVRRDRRQVEGFQPLLSAVAKDDRSATVAAVASLVYAHTHIVRLRVTRAGKLLADVGGPYILAPVSGSLRRGGKEIGRYVLSVQDDLGYVKLVSRFLGVPLVLRAGSHTLPVEGTLTPPPASIPNRGTIDYRGRTYVAVSFDVSAFPSGRLRVSVLTPLSPSLGSRPCSDIRADELGVVARRVSRRFQLAPGNFDAYISVAGSLTSSLLYIPSAYGNRRELAGSTRPGPRSLPLAGRTSYRGGSYRVFSFTRPSTVGDVRVYQLVRE